MPVYIYIFGGKQFSKVNLRAPQLSEIFSNRFRMVELLFKSGLRIFVRPKLVELGGHFWKKRRKSPLRKKSFLMKKGEGHFSKKIWNPKIDKMKNPEKKNFSQKYQKCHFKYVWAPFSVFLMILCTVFFQKPSKFDFADFISSHFS